MKIYCQTCREYVLDTTDKFKPGGPYNGAMFAPPSQARYNVDYFKFQDWVVYGELFCPRCEQQFIIGSPTGGEIILTEHGLLAPGAIIVDLSVSIINKDFSLKTVSEWNPGVVEDRIKIAAEKRQRAINSLFLHDPPKREMETDYETWLSPRARELTCPYCGKVGKNKGGLATHVKACQRKAKAA